MTLQDALRLLAEVHTHDDDQTGFVVDMGAVPHSGYHSAHYVEAWAEVRKAAKLTVEPTK